MINDMMKNPEMMSQMEELMKDPNMMNNLMGMMGGMGGMDGLGNLFNAPNTPTNSPQETNNSSFEQELEHENKLKDIDLNGLDDLEKVDVGVAQSQNKFIQDERVIIKNLNNKLYNNRLASIVNYDRISNRYIIFVDDFNKNISIKEENIEKIENAEDLEEPEANVPIQVTPPTTEAPELVQETENTNPPEETPNTPTE